jgi:hypothetical protein
MKDAALPMHNKDFVLENGSPKASGSTIELEPGQKTKERRRTFSSSNLGRVWHVTDTGILVSI